MNNYSILKEGKRIILRDAVKSDLETVLRWNKTGEHLDYDAPWERAGKDSPTGAQIEEFKAGFLERCEAEKPTPRGNAFISTKDNILIGNVNRYGVKGNQDAPYLGISIQIDDYLNKGLGTEALGLWVDYQFENSEIHRVGVETWSFNPRAIRVIEKAGFQYEGKERELRNWQGEWLDKLHFSMLRTEWDIFKS